MKQDQVWGCAGNTYAHGADPYIVYSYIWLQPPRVSQIHTAKGTIPQAFNDWQGEAPSSLTVVLDVYAVYSHAHMVTEPLAGARMHTIRMITPGESTQVKLSSSSCSRLAYGSKHCSTAS